jgi:2-polyprenyl-3-methyl-5-hydroxy-6-metoxy-1,4-benzoquinol methylase
MERRPEPELMDLPDEARAYADADFRDVNLRFVDAVLAHAGPGDALRVLDLGCGPGDIPIEVARRRPNWSVTAVDAADAMLAIARDRAAAARVTNVTFLLDDAKRLASVAGAFDVVFSNSLLHHLPDPLPFWRRVRELVRPGGAVFLRDLMRPASEAEATRVVQTYAGGESKLLQDEFHRSLLSAFTIDEVKQQLRTAGLSLGVRGSSDRHLDAVGRV